MCSCFHTFYICLYVVAMFFGGIYIKYVNFLDQFECYACKELNTKNVEYDYIIVGSGSAGSIVARRLAENKNFKILLLEAGSRGNNILQIPTMNLMMMNSDFDWQYHTVPQKHACLGLERKESVWHMGKILGGTAMLNNMIYVRGHPEDYARWYQNSCNFNYSIDVLPYFEKLECSSVNSKTGSLPLTQSFHKSNLSAFFLQAGACMGFKIQDTLHSKAGFSSPIISTVNGKRWSPYHQLEAQKFANLVTLTNAFVEKVLFRNETEAYGVQYTHLSEKVRAKARRGVILSAGAVGTPKILMLSGIGPELHLKSLKIKPRVDLPVGDNLQDHVSTGLDLLTVEHPPDAGLPSILSPLSVLNYFFRGKGPWTTPGCESIAFFNTERENVPELQFMIFPLGVTVDSGYHLRTLVGIGDKVYNTYFDKIGKHSFTVLPVVLHPRSRGTLRLKNKNPKTPPLIDPNYLSEQYDVDVLLEGIEMIKEFIETAPMRRLGAKFNPRPFPGCEKLQFDTKAYWECYVRHLTLTVYHPVGTCSMGSVVSDDFQVYGTNKLYVVDGSILPDLPSGNPNGAIMMMAEKAAEIIKHHCWSMKRTCCAMEVFGNECDC